MKPADFRKKHFWCKVIVEWCESNPSVRIVAKWNSLNPWLVGAICGSFARVNRWRRGSFCWKFDSQTEMNTVMPLGNFVRCPTQTPTMILDVLVIRSPHLTQEVSLIVSSQKCYYSPLTSIQISNQEFCDCEFDCSWVYDRVYPTSSIVSEPHFV